MIEFLLTAFDWRLFGLVELLWVIVLSVYILLDRRSPVATLAWILGLALIPFVGLVLYAVFGPRRLTRKRRRRELARRFVASGPGKAWLERSIVETSRGAKADDPGAELAELAVRAGESPPFLAESVDLYFTGREANDAIVADIVASRRYIHLEYYIFEDGEVARRILAALEERARAGVEVCLLVDALGSAGTRDRLFQPLRSAGGTVAYFHPLAFAGLRPSLLNFRTHRKIVVCDGRVGFTGGMNISDDQDDRVAKEKAWRDTHVRLEGDVVATLELVFLEDWAFATSAVPESTDYLLPPTGSGKSRVQVVSSGPDSEAGLAIYHQFFAAIASARHSVELTTPYFVPDESMMTALRTAARRGVRVRLLVPKTGDHVFVAAAARSYYPELVAAGVELYEYGPPNLHAKTLTVDDHYAAVGTANFDARSFRLNFEVIAAFYDPAVVRRLRERFGDDLVKSTRTTEATLGADTFPSRLLVAFAKLFSPIL